MFAKFSVKKPYTVVVAVVLVLILGVVSFTEMVPDLLPDMNLPYAVIVTTYTGASPEEVEMMVTKPVEQSMATINNIKNITSTSSENVSMVMLEFNDDVNMDSVTIDIREKLDSISGYWSDSVGNPIIMKVNMDMMPVMVSALDVEGMSASEITTYANEKIIPQIESVEGVASVSVSGEVEKEVNVVIRQNKLDEANQKVKRSVEDKLKKAEEELKKAKQKVEDGKKELEEKQEQFDSGMLAADQGILEGKLELLKAEIQLADGETALAEKEAELKAAKVELEAAEKELESKEKEAKAGLTTIDKALKEIEPNEVTLEEAKTKLEAAIQTIQNNGMLSKEQKEAAIAPLQGQLDEVNEGLTTLTETKTKLEEQKKTVEDGLKQIETAKKTLEANKVKLAEGEKAIEAGKTQIATGKTGIATGKTTISDKESEVAKTKSEVENQLSSASIQIMTGEKEIDTQLENFKKAKEDALAAADVREIITKDMVSGILTAENFSMPAGYIEQDGVDYLVRVGNKMESINELKALVLFDTGDKDMDPVTLEDVADVTMVDNSAETYAKINGNDGIVLSIQKQTNYSTADVSERVAKRLKELQGENPDIQVNYLMDQGEYINLIVNAVLNNLVMGGVLAIIILFIFLRDIKPTAIIACSIPISVIFAIILMYFSGITLNIISLSGLAVGVGMLVDNSVVVIENIYRLRNKGVSAIKAAVTGAVQVAGAITASTLTTIGVFIPIVFVKGITRQLFQDMALTIAYSLIASLVVALTLVPMMSSRMLKNTKEKEHKLLNVLTTGYEKLLSVLLRFKPLVLIAAVVILVVSMYASMSKGTSFMPSMDSTQVSIDLQMPEGTTLEDTIEMSDKVIEKIQTIEDVETVGAMLAGSTSAMLGMGTGNSATDAVSMYAILKENKKKTSQEVAAEINDLCADFDCEISASGSSMDMSAMGGSGVAINIKGNDLDTLRSLAKEVAKELENVEGLTDISDGIGETTPELRLVVDKEKAMLKGLTVAQVYQQVQSEIASSKTSTTLTQDGEEYSVVIKDEASTELTLDDIKDMKIEATDQEGSKKKVKLSKIAEAVDTETMSSIKRESQQRYITVSAAVDENHNIGLVSAEVEKVLKDHEMPNGFEMEFDGENETINEAMIQMMKMLLLAIAFIYLIMVAQFQSLKSPFIVMFTIPLAFTGGFIGLFIGGCEISVIAMIGFVMLSGIVVNNGIVLVDYINQLRLAGMEKKEAIIEAGKTRMRPIFMTALTTILGLSTMAAGVGMGSDMMQPIAIVTIGGLLYATITTLFVIPVMYDLFNRKAMKKIDKSELEVLDEDMEDMLF